MLAAADMRSIAALSVVAQNDITFPSSVSCCRLQWTNEDMELDINTRDIIAIYSTYNYCGMKLQITSLLKRVIAWH